MRSCRRQRAEGGRGRQKLIEKKREGRLIHLYLHRVDPDQERYRVIWKREGEEVELGSIGIHQLV